MQKALEMSAKARQFVVDSPLTKLSDTDRADLLDKSKTNSNLIALIEHIIQGGYAVGFTAINRDHHFDGSTEHSAGLAFDGWPLRTPTAGDWMDAGEPRFREYLAHVAKFSGIRNIGLAGSAYTLENVSATGLLLTQDPEFADRPAVFKDGGADHVHHDVHPA